MIVSSILDCLTLVLFFSAAREEYFGTDGRQTGHAAAGILYAFFWTTVRYVDCLCTI
jgi:hypothetical protein